ncbi:O-antigen ligase [Allomuricauda sp. SCSIO 65647]|uniref:O-antigen ligase family protein n=1 Tax=Allomuricauda sp. SCSIO 65647 TaxID=2908843 RepID=UPI001F31F3F0|nr:O-antigen ligase family protein [Muricauda sp. SCSIO 65647]UJH67027.1 O-antigen ligase family protein [Muricauda sp. SCSIO 65647]
MIASFMCAFIALSFNQDDRFERFFHFGFITSIVLLIFFEYRVGNFSLIGFINPTVSRGDFLNNANYYSYISLFANFSLFRLHLLYKNRFTYLGLLLLPPLMLAMSFVTQSRSGLLFILIINVIFWYWVVNSAHQKSYIKVLRFLSLGIITIFLAIQFIGVYSQSSIRGRVEATDRDARGALVELGLEAFMDHPFLGLGLGQFPRYSKTGLFTHNTYVEALAEHGFFIGGVVILVFVLPLFKATSLLRRFSKNQFIKLNFLFFFIFLFYNNVFVFYKASSAMMFFFLMIGIQQRLEKKHSANQKSILNVP